MSALLLLTVAVSGSIAAFHYLLYPHWATVGLWTIVLGVSAYNAGGAAYRIAAVNLAAVFLALWAFESWLWLTQPEQTAAVSETSYDVDYYRDHPVLGYGPIAGIHTGVVKTHGGETAYRATYTIDEHGLRATPRASEANRSVLFFGGSVTFGEGLDDAQAMPNRVAELVGGEMQVYNFGFHGYGPHQMLAAFRGGLVSAVVELPAVAVVYQAIPAHVARAAGRAPWDKQGPWYRLDEGDRLSHAGRFDQRLGARIDALLGGSLTYRKIFGHERQVTVADVALFGAIVEAAREASVGQFPRSQFHVLLWGNPDNVEFLNLQAELRRRAIPVHAIHEILPAYASDPKRYEISPHDKHPNPLAQDLIARYVATHIVGVSVTGSADPSVVSEQSDDFDARESEVMPESTRARR